MLIKRGSHKDNERSSSFDSFVCRTRVEWLIRKAGNLFPSLGNFILPIHTYGAFLAVAFIAGIGSGIYHGRLLGISSDRILDIALWFMLGAMGGARILYIILYPQQFPTVLSWFAFNKGGLVFFGGFVSTVIVLILYCRYYEFGIRDLGDITAPSLALGHTIGRIGCFFNGCCYGIPTKSSLGMVFPSLGDNLSRHPTQLYEAVFLALLVAATSYLFHLRVLKKRFFRGAVWGFYVFSYALFRFFIEQIRGDDRGGFFTSFHLSISQCVSILSAIFAVAWILFCWKLDKKPISQEVMNEKDGVVGSERG